jgi:betaine reductase
MDPDDQDQIRAHVAGEDRSEFVVLLGASNPEAIKVAAETVSQGDPSYVGPLAGVQLGLPVFHILDEEIKAQVDQRIWDEQLGLLELALDVESIRETMREVREEIAG